MCNGGHVGPLSLRERAHTMAPLEVSVDLLKSQRMGQSVRPRRCSMDLARRRFYSQMRTIRLGRLGERQKQEGK